MTPAGRARRAALVALTSLALLKVGALMVCGGPHCRALAFDNAVLTAMHAWRTPGLDLLFATLTWGGSMYMLMPLALLAAARERAASAWRRSFVPLALLSTWALVHIAKLVVERPRPGLFEPLIALPADNSFPSAHAAQVTALACAWLLRPGSRARPASLVALTLAVAVVSASRLYLQVHYPSDVLFAVTAGALWVVALRLAFDAHGERR